MTTKSPQKHRKYITLLGKIALILLGIIFAVLLAEGVARLLGPPYAVGNEVLSLHQCDRQVGWRGVANGSSRIDWYDHDHPFVLNSRGFHDREHTLVKADDVFRILMLGDSMLAAVEVAEVETSRHILEETLNAQAPPGLKFEVINGAVFAWGPQQELIYFRTEGQQFKPDLVLVSWFPKNDLRDVIPYHVMTMGPTGGVHCFSPYFAICNGQFDPDIWYPAPGIPPQWQECTFQRKVVTNVLNFAYHHSRLYQRLTALLLRVYEKETYATGLYAPWLDFDHQDPVLNRSYQLTQDIYTQLAREAEAVGAKTAFFISPINEAIAVDVNPERRAAVVAGLPVLEQADPALPNQVFTELMVQQSLPVYNLHPDFVTYIQQTGQSLHWSDVDSHWNVAGNRLAGERLAAWLIEKHLVPLEAE
ncbi:MAG: hypothetical protein H6631_14355 [Anaerolineaceae bacterium]|nr:hypothetical protein [Anaerolineaceae bacterium]